jgi:uncharacterized YccA/Bax inhibitor family protein
MYKYPALAVIFLGTLSFSMPAYAYLDPGTGSIILQLLLGGTAGLLMVGKLYWHKLKSIFGIKSAPDDQEETKDPIAQ